MAQREGLSLLFVQAPDGESTHGLVVAAQNVPRGVFEEVKVSQFPMETEDLMGIGSKLSAIGERFDEAEVKRFFRREDLW